MIHIRKYNYVNIRMLLRVIGLLLLIETLFMLIPTIVGLCLGEEAVMSFVWTVLISAGMGGVMVSIKPRVRDMGKREAILLTGLTWIVFSMFGMLPFLFCSTHLSITDAFFETMSGFTTTGASILESLEGIPRCLLIWRCVIEWIGGMGIILFTLAVVPMLNYQGGIQLFNAEVTGITHDKLRPRVSSTAKSLWLVYISLTCLLIVFLLFSDLPVYEAFCCGLSTMSTGGFATTNMTILETGSLYIKCIMIIFMFLGGVNFALIYKSMCGEFRYAWRNDTLKWYVIAVFLAYAALNFNLIMEGLAHTVADVTIDPLFQAVSIISSTGLTEPDFADWGALSVIALLIMMFTGACAGSTSGGAKLDRIIVLLKFIKNEFYKMMHPNSVTVVSMNGKGTPNPLVMKVLSFLFLYLLVILFGGILLTFFGLPLSNSFFYTLSAISNTGLGTGAAEAGGTFGIIPDAVKWILALIMLIGRLELYTILLWFTPVFWKK